MAGFPIFIDLAKGEPLVVGAGALALAKVRLLLKKAPRVAVAAEALSPELVELATAGAVSKLAARPQASDIAGRPLVVSATGEGGEDRRVYDTARALGVPVNVPDRPDMSTFALAAIVDRGEVTVAIGTEGAAPILATQLRARLERELDPRLGRLAAIAREFRPQVQERIAPGPERRAFWEAVFAGPAAQAILAGDEAEGRRIVSAMLGDRGAMQTPKRGRVLLVGAGPGDPELLTLKAVRALKCADVILVDGHVGEGVLDHARREAQVISVAKARGWHSKTQAEINALIVAFAREGKTVVRLKGGDPFVFGRGGEEVDILRASGIAVEVVPGITAAVAAAASLQIPLTHRDHSRSVTFISGHAAGDGAAEFDQAELSALAGRRATLAVYMGLATSAALAASLLAAGWSPATPVIAIENVSRANERRVALTLDALETGATHLGLTGPTLLMVGEVASLPAAGTVERAAAALIPASRREFIDA